MPVGQRGSGAGGQSKYTSEEFISAADRPAAPQPRSPILVLVSPQDIVNIASAVRIAKNFGIERMRLVNPEVFDPYRIEGIAHNTAELVEQSTAGPVAIVAGREDSGLTNAELDLCNAVVTIATDPAHRSLNLAQAVAIMAYESWIARGGECLPLKPPRNQAAPATSGQLEELFQDWTRALWAIDFFKTRQPENVMRSFREIVFRAEPDGREASLLRAMGIEVVRFLNRTQAKSS